MLTFPFSCPHGKQYTFYQQDLAPIVVAQSEFATANSLSKLRFYRNLSLRRLQNGFAPKIH